MCTGTFLPTTPTATAGDNSCIIANTNFVQTALSNAQTFFGGSFSGDGTSTTDPINILVPASVKTAAYTANHGDFVPVDTTSGSVTITLPSAPVDGTLIGVKMVVQGSSNTVTIQASGADVFNKTSGGTTLPVSLLNQTVILQYQASTGIWYVISDGLSLTQLDSRYNPLITSSLPLSPTLGGTGVSGTSTLTLGGNLITTGSFTTTFQATASATFMLPSANQTLASLAGSEAFTNKTIASGNTLGAVTMSLGSDAAGDIYYTNASGILKNLAIGSSPGLVLTVSSGGLPTWAPATGGVTSIAAGTGLTGGTITSSGTIALDTTVAPNMTGLWTFTQNSLGTTPTSAITLQNTTAAATGAQQISPQVTWTGQGWSTTGKPASMAVQFSANVLPVQQTSAVPTANWQLKALINGVTTTPLQITSAGALTIAGSLTMSGTIVGLTGVTATSNLTAQRNGGATVGDALISTTNVTATSGSPLQVAPALMFNGSVWNTTPTAAANQFNWRIYATAVSGTTPVTKLTIASSLVPGTTASYTDRISIDNTGNFSLLTAGQRVFITEGSNGIVGQTTLVSGTKTISISGVTTSSRAIITFVSINGGTVSTTWQYAAVCTSNTLTITALTSSNATNTSDTSIVNYFIIN